MKSKTRYSPQYIYFSILPVGRGRLKATPVLNDFGEARWVSIDGPEKMAKHSGAGSRI